MLAAKDVDGFFVSTVSNALRQARAPGGVFVVVGGGEVVAQRAFGVSDLKTGQPVSPESTLFRVASVSKIFTSIAVMELVDEGRLDLHADVNRYLDGFQIPAAFGEPITLHHLLTHSAGFDVCRLQYGSRTEGDRLGLEDYLEQLRPTRLRSPGLCSTYSNYGLALAGYVVQGVAGASFPAEMRRRLLDPLGMTDSSFAPDPEMRQRLAIGHQIERGVLMARAPDYVNIRPAAGLCATAADMARFLRALTGSPLPDGTPAFSDLVVDGLRTTKFNLAERVPGRTYGFNMALLAGRPALVQTGQWPGFNAAVALFPGTDHGVFIAYNLCDDFAAGERVLAGFARQFVPAPASVSSGSSVSSEPTENRVGTFENLRQPFDTLILGAAAEVDVTRSGTGSLLVDGVAYRDQGGDVFRRETARAEPGETLGRNLAFRALGDPAREYLVAEGATYRRLPWWRSTEFFRLRARLVAAILISPLVLWPITALVRFMAGRRLLRSDDGRLARAATTAAWSFALLGLGFQAAFALAAKAQGPFALFYGVPESIGVIALAAPVVLAATVCLVGLAVLVWRRGCWSLFHRLHYSCIVLAAVGLSAEILRRNLLSVL